MRIARYGAFATAALLVFGAAALAQTAPRADILPGTAAEGAPEDDAAAVAAAVETPAAQEEEGEGVELILRSFAAPPPEHGDGLDPATVRPESAFLLDGISAALLRGPDETPPRR